MSQCDATALLQSGACFCKVTVDPLKQARLALLCQILQGLNPMQTCDVPTLMQAAKCFCSVTVDPEKMVELQLLANILLASDPAAAVDVPSLMQQAKCFCSVTTSPYEQVKLALLCDIQSAGGGGGGCSYQNFEIAWTPTTALLGEMALFYTNGVLPGITSITFEAAANPYGYDVDTGSVSGSVLASLAWPNLTTLTPNINTPFMVINGQTVLASISLPLLTNCPGRFFVNNNPALPSFSAPSLASVGGNLEMYGNTVMTSVSLPALQTAGVMLIFNNPALASINLSSYVPTNGNTEDYANNALTAAAIDAILTRYVANSAYVSGTINLSGGTTAAPDAAGLALIAILTGRGVTVNHN